jgi:predicted permease
MGFVNDLRLALRGLGRSAGFAVVVILTLGLGIGLSTAVFSVVNGVLLRPLVYDGADRLVYVQARREAEGTVDALVSGGDWRAFREGVSALESLEAVGTIRQTLTGAGLPRQVQVGWVSPGFLSMLGVAPALGRLMEPGDPPGTAVLSHAVWSNELGGDAGVVGRVVGLDGSSYTVVGVMPAGFRLELPSRAGRAPVVDIWKNPDRNWQNGDVWGERGPEFGLLRMVGKRAPGASLGTAQAQADAVLAALLGEDGRYQSSGFGVTVHDLHGRLVADARPMLLLLMGAVAFVLAIACANAANLLLVRANGRQRELAVRVAMGAGHARVVRYLLAETLLLAAAGGAVGIALAMALVELLPLLGYQGIPRLETASLDGTVAAFAVVAALCTTLLVGVAPALTATRADPASILGNARASHAGGGWVRDGLVVAQVALSLVLLVGAGLLVSSLMRLNRVDPGFDPDGLFTFAVSIPGTEYGWPDEAGRYYRSVQERVAALPGVRGAGVVWPMPFSSSWGGDLSVGGSGEPVGVVPYYLATEEYFGAAGIPLVEGRLFEDGDPRETAVVSEATARRAFPDGSALGRTLSANPWGGGAVDFQVIGVVGDVRHGDLREPTQGGIYFDARGWSWVDWEVHVMVRTDVAAATLVPAIRTAVSEIDADVPVARADPMSERIAAGNATARFVLALLGVFAAASALLAVVGLYGVVSYSVGLRRRELGIRMALGSARESIRRLVVGRGVVVACVGVGIGTLASLALGGVLERHLYEVRSGDPATLAAAAGLMVALAALASWVPALRAARTDPVLVLKAD